MSAAVARSACLAARAQHEIHALGRERFGRCAPEPAARRGDERDLPANAEVHRYFFTFVWK